MATMIRWLPMGERHERLELRMRAIEERRLAEFGRFAVLCIENFRPPATATPEECAMAAAHVFPELLRGKQRILPELTK